MIAWNNIQLVEVKLTKKNWEVQTGTPFPQVLDIAQDGNLRQCLTSSRAETSKKNLIQIRASQAQIGAEIIFSVLMSLGVQACFSF